MLKRALVWAFHYLVIPACIAWAAIMSYCTCVVLVKIVLFLFAGNTSPIVGWPELLVGAAVLAFCGACYGVYAYMVRHVDRPPPLEQDNEIEPFDL